MTPTFRVTSSWSGGVGAHAVLVHGGAGVLEERPEVAASGCRSAAEAAHRVLAGGGSALEAVLDAVTVLEDDPRYNAGIGAALTEDGDVELDASVMEGRELRAGAVCMLRGYRNAVRAAHAALVDGRHVLYAGEGAREVGRRAGLVEVAPAVLVTEAARQRLSRFLAGKPSGDPGNTVGAVARDRHGNVAAATSTGGTTGKRRGRVGDSPILGAGTYAENGAGAASATGHGEGILRVTLTARVVAALRSGAAAEPAARDALELLGTRVGSTGGLIVTDGAGRLAWARTTAAMPWAALWDGGGAHGV